MHTIADAGKTWVMHKVSDVCNDCPDGEGYFVQSLAVATSTDVYLLMRKQMFEPPAPTSTSECGCSFDLAYRACVWANVRRSVHARAAGCVLRRVDGGPCVCIMWLCVWGQMGWPGQAQCNVELCLAGQHKFWVLIAGCMLCYDACRLCRQIDQWHVVLHRDWYQHIFLLP